MNHYATYERLKAYYPSSPFISKLEQSFKYIVYDVNQDAEKYGAVSDWTGTYFDAQGRRHEFDVYFQYQINYSDRRVILAIDGKTVFDSDGKYNDEKRNFYNDMDKSGGSILRGNLKLSEVS